MRENVTISYRGSSHELGQGPGYYGIWTIGAPRSEPLERWPDTAAGWSVAATRLTQLEEPGTIVPVSQHRVAQRPGAAAIVAAAFLGVGVALGIAGLFPSGAASLARQADELVPHLTYLAAWGASAVLVLLGGGRQRVGALVALGTSVVTFGLFFADAAYAITAATKPAIAGLVLGLIGWLACTIGSLLALRLRRPADQRLAGWRQGDGHRVAATVAAVVAGLGAAITFAPSWDRFTLRSPAGVVQSFTAGNAFANPALVIVGDVAVMVAVIAIVVRAITWRQIRLGSALLAGALVPLVAQAISALIQFGQPVSPAQFLVPPAVSARLGLTVSTTGTFVFWVYCAFVVGLALSCAQMALSDVAPESLSAPAGDPPESDPVPVSVAAAVGSGDESTQVSPA